MRTFAGWALFLKCLTFVVFPQGPAVDAFKEMHSAMPSYPESFSYGAGGPMACQDIVVVTEKGKSFAFVTWDEPATKLPVSYYSYSYMYSAFYPYPVDGWCNEQPGFFNIGVHPVQCEAFLCNFIITVLDEEKPIVHCPPPITENTEPGKAVKSVRWSYPFAEDNSNINPTASCVPKSNTVFSIGIKTVECMATDGSGNEGKCIFTVTVVDKEPPFIDPSQCTHRILSTSPGSDSAEVVGLLPTATDNSGENPIVTCQPDADFKFPIGEHPVSCKAVDSAGNDVSCKFTVTIEDNENPTFVSCPSSMSQNTSPGSDVAQVTWYVQATDNSGVEPSVKCQPPSDSDFQIGDKTVMCTAADDSGNIGACSFTVTVTDNEKPVFETCPSSFIEIASPGVTVTQVMWDDPQATDNSGILPSMECEPEKDSDFELGENPVTCIARDAAGNSVQCLFTVTIEGWCPNDLYKFGKNLLTFRETTMNTIQLSLENCVTDAETGAMQPIASRRCDGNAQDGTFWHDPVFRQCSTIDIDVNDQLDRISQVTVTDDNIEDLTDALIDLTNHPSSLDYTGVSSTAYILDGAAAVGNPSSEVTENVVQAVNNLIQAPANFFQTKLSNAPLITPPETPASNTIVQSLEKQISNTLSQGGNFSAVTPNLAVKGLNLPPKSFHREGLAFATIYNMSGDGNLDEDKVLVLGEKDGLEVGEIETKIYLPGELINNLPLQGHGKLPISFVIYQNSKLFCSPSLNFSDASSAIRREVGSRIIAASVDSVNVNNLPAESSVTSIFRITIELAEGETLLKNTRECVFWNFSLNDGNGDWSKKGCQTVAVDHHGLTICKCNHLTSFAVLVDIYGESTESPTLDIISKIGCGVSIIALILTIGIYMSIKSLRAKIPSQILICLCLSLLGLYSVFLVGIEQTDAGRGCLIVAVLLHYFTLSSLAWMAVEATNMYLYLVKVIRGQLRHFLFRASLAAWGIPGLVIILIVSIDYTQYENSKHCFLKPGNAFYFGQLLILGLVLAYNTALYVSVLVNLYFRPGRALKSSVHQRQTLTQRLQNAVAISSLVGLTWVFGLLSVFQAANSVFNALFAIFNSLQGLAVFLLFSIRQARARFPLMKHVRRYIQTSSIFKIDFSSNSKSLDSDLFSSDDQHYHVTYRNQTASTFQEEDFKHPCSVPQM